MWLAYYDAYGEYLDRAHVRNYPFYGDGPPKRYDLTALVYRYTRGQCFHFARALNSLTGWPVVGLSYGEDPPDHYACIHALCLNPEGKLVDIEGVHEPDDVVNDYGCLSYHVIGRYWYGRIRPDCCNHAEQYARRWILRNPERVGLELAKRVSVQTQRRGSCKASL